MKTRISFIIPTYNVATYILETLKSIEGQIISEDVEIEISIRDDCSSDNTFEICSSYFETSSSLLNKTISGYVLTRSETREGAGVTRNVAVAQSTGELLCFNDADDISLPSRCQTQFHIWKSQGSKNEVLIGSKFVRDPPDATHHYSAFLNNLSQDDLYLKAFRELTLIQPTWFMSRKFFDFLGGYTKGILAEDLELFYRILDVPNVILRSTEEPLVIYRHLEGSVSSKTSRKELVKVRVRAFERQILSQTYWEKFSVWGAGRDGRAFFDELEEEFKMRISAYYDVDENKIKSSFHHSGYIIPIHHFSKIQPPFVVCVALGRTAGQLEENVKSLQLVEGTHYWFFN